MTRLSPNWYTIPTFFMGWMNNSLDHQFLLQHAEGNLLFSWSWPCTLYCTCYDEGYTTGSRAKLLFLMADWKSVLVHMSNILVCMYPIPSCTCTVYMYMYPIPCTHMQRTLYPYVHVHIYQYPHIIPHYYFSFMMSFIVFFFVLFVFFRYSHSVLDNKLYNSSSSSAGIPARSNSFSNCSLLNIS